MGFRKLEEFNRALLANQFWRLMRRPDSLASQVLKARYFRHGNIMEARLGNNPSFVWRSLLWSKDIIERGSVWRVGDGKSIKLFEDKWVPSLTSKISVPNDSWHSDTTVNSLIKDGIWDVDLIIKNFNPYIAGEIRKIPLSLQSNRDALFWRFDPKGHFSVRDGYRLQRGLFLPPKNQSEYSMDKWWSFIWNLSIPPKERIFWWRV